MPKKSVSFNIPKVRKSCRIHCDTGRFVFLLPWDHDLVNHSTPCGICYFQKCAWWGCIPEGIQGDQHHWKLLKLRMGHNKPDALQEIIDIKGTVESHTKKVVQMHQPARNFAGQLQEKVDIDDDLIDSFGDTFRYRTIYLGTLPNEEFVTAEEFGEGTVAEHVNNDGLPCGNDEISQKAVSFSLLICENQQRSDACWHTRLWLWSLWPR